MKRGTPEHPKVIELALILKIPRYAAVGILECLWHFTAEFAPQGNIGKHSDRAIAGACYWHGEPSRFVKALVAAQLLSESDALRLVVWDWHDHADDYTRKKLQRKSLAFLSVRTIPDNSRLPKPVPMPKPEPCAAGQVSTSAEKQIAESAERLYAAHPKKANLVLIPGALIAAVNGAGDVAAKLKQIEKCHAAWCLTSGWTERSGQFATKLDIWLTDKGFTKWPDGIPDYDDPNRYKLRD